VCLQTFVQYPSCSPLTLLENLFQCTPQSIITLSACNGLNTTAKGIWCVTWNNTHRTIHFEQKECLEQKRRKSLRCSLFGNNGIFLRFESSTCRRRETLTEYLTEKGHFFVIFTNLINPLNAELNPTCHLLALLETRHILHVSRTRVKKNAGTASSP